VTRSPHERYPQRAIAEGLGIELQSLAERHRASDNAE
jgi:hypothetical protein